MDKQNYIFIPISEYIELIEIKGRYKELKEQNTFTIDEKEIHYRKR